MQNVFEIIPLKSFLDLQPNVRLGYNCTNNPVQVSAKGLPGIDYRGSKDPRILTCSTKPLDWFKGYLVEGNFVAYDVVDDPNDEKFTEGTLKILKVNRAACNRPTHECLLYKSLLKDVLDHVRSESGMNRTIKQSVNTIKIPAENVQHEDFVQYCMDILETTKEAGFKYIRLKNEFSMSSKCLDKRNFYEPDIESICQDYNNALCFDHENDINFDHDYDIVITKPYNPK